MEELQHVGEGGNPQIVRLKCHLPTAWLQCSRWYLKRTTTFNGDHYLQINGTAMAPSYANICMGKLEKQLLESSIERPLSWYRFIDDVDMKWTLCWWSKFARF
jgi:hypothetical protein